MNNLKTYEEYITEQETGAYSAPKFAKRPAAGDTGYAMMSKAFGSTPGPKKKKKNSRTQEVKE
jgi:hypothetical protein